jgi:hypothetical protein
MDFLFFVCQLKHLILYLYGSHVNLLRLSYSSFQFCGFAMYDWANQTLRRFNSPFACEVISLFSRFCACLVGSPFLCRNCQSSFIIFESIYPRITYYWTVLLILDHSYLTGKLTSSKIAVKVSGEREFLRLLFQQFLNLSSSQWDVSGPVLGALSNNRWLGVHK